MNSNGDATRASIEQSGAWTVTVVTQEEPAPTENPKTTYKAERVTVTQEEAQRFSGRVVGHGGARSVHVQGPCPSCDHPTLQSVGLSVVGQDSSAGALVRLGQLHVRTLDVETIGPGEAASAPGTTAPQNVFPVAMTCRCGRPHAEPGADTYGCGSAWMLQGTTGSANATFAPAADAFLPRWRDLEAIASLNAEAATKTREAAGKWQSALLGLLTLTGVIAAVGGRDGLAELDKPWAVGIGGGVVVLLLVSAGAALWGQLASTGLPQFNPTDSEVGLATFSDDPLRQAVESRDRLRELSIAAIGGFLLSLVLLVLLWIAPSMPATAQQYDITFRGGATLKCVTTEPASDPRFLLVTADDGTTTTVRRVASVASMSKAVCD